MDQQKPNRTLRIGLAQARNVPDFDERLETIDRMLGEAADQDVAIVCFPEAYLPGLRGQDFPVPPPDQERQEAALARVRASARRHGVAAIIGMEWEAPAGQLNIAVMIDRDGELQGHQAKNQIAPVEDPYYVPEGSRRMFAIDGVPFGIAICHEGWRYPETVRWAAVRGAKVVFHPQMSGTDLAGVAPRHWCDPEAPYYEKAMIARAVENEIYFASVNNAVRYQESATCVVGPEGDLVASPPYGEEALLVVDLDLSRATGLYARRFKTDWYGDG